MHIGLYLSPPASLYLVAPFTVHRLLSHALPAPPRLAKLHTRLLATSDDAHHLRGEPSPKPFRKTDRSSFDRDLPFQVIVEGSHPAFSSGRLRRTRPLAPEISVKNFFARGKAVAVIVDVLNRGASEEELQEALRGLPVPLDNPLVVQVLRGDLPCDIALSFFHWLKCMPGFQHNEFTYGVMLNNLGRAGHLHDMQQLFDQMKAEGCLVTRATLSHMMGWFYKAKDMQRIAHHWTTIRCSGTKPSAAIYHGYIEFLLATNRHSKIAKVHEEMLRLKCLPNSRTYSLFIEHLVIAGNVEAASKIMKLMQNMKMIPSRVAYRNIINGYARLGNIEGVLENLKEMREHFYKPTMQFMPAVQVLQAAGKLEEVSNLLDEITPDPSQKASSLIEENMNTGDDADAVTTVWRSTACPHLVFDIGSFVDALYAWNQNVEQVLEQENLQWESSLVLGVLRRLKTLDSLWPFFHWVGSKAGFRHDSYSCAFLVQGILKSRLTSEKLDLLVRELFAGLVQDTVRLSVSLFNLVIQHHVALGEAEKASNMLHLLKDFGLKPNKITFALVIQGFAKCGQGKKAAEFFREMKKRGFSPDSDTCAELITCFGLAGKTQHAYALFCKITEFGRRPDCIEYKSILEMFFRAGENGMALKLYEDMLKDGIRPTQDMYDVVTGILRTACRFSDVGDLAQERSLLNFFDGNKKALQESLLEVLFTFTEGLKRRTPCGS